MKTKHHLRSLLALLLICSLFAQILPTPVHAAETEPSPMDAPETPGEVDEIPDTDALEEEPSLRSANSKTFLMEDGSHTVATYGITVHYADENGNWQPIDNRLVEADLVYSKEGQEAIHGYQTVNGDRKVFFPESLSDGLLYHYEKGDYRIEMSLLPLDTTDPEAMSEDIILGSSNSFDASAELMDPSLFTPELKTTTKLEELSTLQNIASGLIYHDIIPGTDLQYELCGTTVKESIWIHEPDEVSDSYVYVFLLSLNGLQARLTEQGDIEVYDPSLEGQINEEGQDLSVKYLIPSPYLKDSSEFGESREVHYELEEIPAESSSAPESVSYRLRIDASADWINAPDRVWPIQIDPTILESTYANAYDTMVIEGTPNTGYSTDTALNAGWSSYQNHGRIRSYWKYDPLPALPPACIVTNSQLRLYQFVGGYNGNSGSENMYLGIREVTSDWNLSTTTWNNQSAFGSDVLDYVVVNSSSNGSYVYLDITSLVQDWYAESKPNYGVAIFPAREYGSGNTSTTQSHVMFGSSNHTGTNTQPAILVTYRDAKGLEGYWTYHNQSLGASGTGYVNDFTGNLTYVYGDMTSIGNVLPVSVGHVYSGYLAGKNFTTGNAMTVDYSMMKIGAGWRLNVQETVITTTISGTTYYVHTDSDGTEHYYYNQNSTPAFESEDGLHLTITKSGNNYTMSDDYGNTKYFMNGKLTSVTDSLGNQKIYVYNNNGQLVTIKEQNQGETNPRDIITLTYVNNYLSKITDALDTTDTITYYYSSSTSGTLVSESGLSGLGTTAYLRQIVHTKGTTTNFVYTSEGYLNGVRDTNTMRKLVYNYGTTNIKGRVNKVIESGYDFATGATVTGQTLGITYTGHKTTIFRTSGKDDIYENEDDITDTYVMDNWGRTICTYSNIVDTAANSSKLPKQIMSASAGVYDNGADSFRNKNKTVQTSYTGGWATSGDITTDNLAVDGGCNGGTGWTCYVGTSSVSLPGDTGNKVIQIVGDHTDLRSAQQTITLNEPGTRTYTLSGWARAMGVSNKSSDNLNQSFEIRAVITYTDNTVERHYCKFNTDVWVWQYNCIGIVPKQPTKTVKTIALGIRFDYQPNVAYFDNIRLVKEPSPTWKYDSNGNLISIKAEDGTQESLVYTGTDLTKETLPDGDEYTYTYQGNTHLVQTVTNKAGVKITYTRDAYGNVTKAEGSNSHDSVKIWTEASYTDSGRFLSTVTDASDNTTTYNTNTTTGLLESVQDPKGISQHYTYDSKERIASVGVDEDGVGGVTGNEPKVQYSYLHDRMDTIQTNTSKYYFSYDYYGNVTSIGVSGASGSSSAYTLAQYTYNNKNGKLNRMTYGNGAYYSYVYDNQERIQTVQLNGTNRATYSYNNDNLLDSLTDHVNGYNMTYEYDRIGRLTGWTSAQPALGSMGAVTLTGAVSYDSAGRVSSRNTSIGSSTHHNYTLSYKTDSSLPDEMTLPNSETIKYVYDNLERVTEKRLKSGNTTLSGNSYVYETVATNRTGNRIVSETLLGSNTSYTYTYDNNGNITQIKKGSTVIATYTYDSLNRLKTEKGTDNITYTYNYDPMGNITSVQQKPSGGTMTTIATYSYSSSWGDLLTQYNSQNITYDNAGNPLTYNNGQAYTFTWIEGRRLDTVTTGGVTTEYLYNVDGLRTGKKVGNTWTRYFWDGDRIIRDNRSGTYMDFYYDEAGQAVSVRVKTGSSGPETFYYYGRNIFGDIVEIYDASGNVVAKYTYNAWGEVLSVTDASGNAITNGTHIGNLNPLRYRGYYYDSETGFYYLQSRYYDPVTKRFLNADETSILLTTPKELFNKNLYSYCDNSPIIRKDSSGECWFLVGALFGVITQYVCDVASNLMNGETFVESLTPKSTWADYLSAAVSGAVATTGIGLLGSITINAALGGATYLVNCDIKGVEADPENLMLSTVIGGVAGAIGGKGANLSEAKGIINTSNKIISSTVSASVRQQYANKIAMCFKGIVKSAIRAFSAGVASNILNDTRRYYIDSIS
ncbi:MAG: RHS repeat-associated core domain-containing protein [Firmicutes bacterium]|nr:RHS repeat-associated core domain-containing protein [Bacillota bacterium]